MRKYRPHLLAAMALAILMLSGLQPGLQNRFADWRFGFASRPASGDIVIIAIDSASLRSTGAWPWSRRIQADLVDRLRLAGASDITFDIDFSRPSDEASDDAFANALTAADGAVVLPSFRQYALGSQSGPALHAIRPLPKFAERAGAALVDVDADPDGRVRRYAFGEQLDGRFVPTLGAVLTGRYDHAAASFLIDFGIQRSSIPTISAADVLRGDVAALQAIRGRKLIVGVTAPELGDRFSVPNGGEVSGPVLQALAAESLLQQRALTESSIWLTVSGLCLLVLIMILAWRQRSAWLRAALLVGMSLTVAGIAIMMQVWFPVVVDTSLFQVAIDAYLLAVVIDAVDFSGIQGWIAERRFQRITMALGDGLVCADPRFAITIWNPGAEAIFGYRSHEIMGMPFDRICARAGDGSTVKVFAIGDVPQDLLQAPGGQVVEFEGRRKNGEVFPVEACFSGWEGVDGFQYGAVLRDISVRTREVERIRYLAEYDVLTGLPNRNALQAHLDAVFADDADPPRAVMLLVISIDKFQDIGDMLGHGCGDLVLQAVAQRLSARIGDRGFVAWLSGDEFAVYIDGASEAAATAICQSCALAFTNPLLAGSREFRIKLSIGVAMYPGDAATVDDLVGNAHLALYRAKAVERTGFVLYRRAFRDELEARLNVEAELGRAIGLDQFELYYQPQVTLSDRRVIGAEALIRWRHPLRGLVSPGNFMPVVNASPMSNRVAGWVMDTACRQARSWELMGHSICISVNLSPSQFHIGDLAASVRLILAATGLTPALLELEVTEDILLDDADKLLAIFAEIRSLGVRIVFDDFGTGYASLSYLKQFPLDGLKVDQSFVRELRTDRNDAAIVQSTIDLSRKLGLSVIAEGIEDAATADLLSDMGCEHAQGYFFGRPMPAADFEAKVLPKLVDAAAG